MVVITSRSTAAFKNNGSTTWTAITSYISKEEVLAAAIQSKQTILLEFEYNQNTTKF